MKQQVLHAGKYGKAYIVSPPMTFIDILLERANK